MASSTVSSLPFSAPRSLTLNKQIKMMKRSIDGKSLWA